MTIINSYVITTTETISIEFEDITKDEFEAMTPEEQNALFHSAERQAAPEIAFLTDSGDEYELVYQEVEGD